VGPWAIILPTSPGLTGSKFSLTTRTSYPGHAEPIHPGLTFLVTAAEMKTNIISVVPSPS
jgi:hypothetical protein